MPSGCFGRDDQLNVVVYDHEVDTVLERMPAAAAAKKQALAAWAGLTRAAKRIWPKAGSPAPVAERCQPEDRVRRVLLLTDGLANQGLTDAASLREAAAGSAPRASARPRSASGTTPMRSC